MRQGSAAVAVPASRCRNVWLKSPRFVSGQPLVESSDVCVNPIYYFSGNISQTSLDVPPPIEVTDCPVPGSHVDRRADTHLDA